MRISKLLPDATKLTCTGTVAVNVNGAPIELPITSEGVLELRDEMAHHKPIAPKKALTIKADSETGKELGLNEDTVKLVQDETDENYIRQLNQYHEDFLWQIVIKGLTIDFEDITGTPIEDVDGKKAILIANGITIAQIQTIFNAIMELGLQHSQDLDAYIERSVGITKAIKRKMVSNAKKNKGTGNTGTFNEVNIMSEYSISPNEWAELSSIDKRVLNYSLLLKYHQEAERMDEMKRQQKLESNKQRVMGKLPTFGGKGGR